MSLKRVGRVFVVGRGVPSLANRLVPGDGRLEATGRMLGAYDITSPGGRNAVWEIAVTTKDVQGNR